MKRCVCVCMYVYIHRHKLPQLINQLCLLRLKFSLCLTKYHSTKTYTYLLTYSMVQDILEKLIVTQLLSLWNPEIHYRAHKSPPLDPILSQPNSVHPIDSYLPKVHFNVILPSTPRSSRWSRDFGPPSQDPINTPHHCVPHVLPTSSFLI
jgi:hypothetical protein